MLKKARTGLLVASALGALSVAAPTVTHAQYADDYDDYYWNDYYYSDVYDDYGWDYEWVDGWVYETPYGEWEYEESWDDAGGYWEFEEDWW